MALANSISSTDNNGAGDEILNNFSGTFSWDFTMGTPGPGDFSFITVALHELGHGLGFSGSAAFDDGAGSPECAGVAGEGCIGFGASGNPFIYDRFTEDGAATALLSYASPSAALGTALLGGAAGVFFSGTATGTAALYAPGAWAGGSSYSHFDSGAFPLELMNPFVSAGTANFSPGLAVPLFSDLGWIIKPPVELTSFTATTDGEGVMLRWETSSETNNAGFDVQVRGPGDEAFGSAGFVEGNGTTTEEQSYTYRLDELRPGTYAFRLYQLDFDGQSEFSPEVEATVEVPDGYMLAAPYPNPFNPEAVVEFAVADSRPVRIEMFNVLGQQVAVLFDGIPEAGQTQQVRIDGSRLPSGAYLVRLIGENIMATQRVTLVK